MNTVSIKSLALGFPGGRWETVAVCALVLIAGIAIASLVAFAVKSHSWS
jgi:hypothetical protein